MANIRNIDLNLLRVFEALMHERSVTRAASRLALSQPAVSAALGRLRGQLGDQLLVRTRGGMRPTPRAEEIFALVAQSLDLIQNALQSGTSFAPARSQRPFTVMMSDVGEVIYLPRLIQRMQQDAPGVRLIVRRLARSRVYEELSSGSIDLAIGWMDRPGDLCRTDLFKEDFVCIVRPGHPRVSRRLTASQFRSEWHLAVGRQGLGSDVSYRAADEPLKQGTESAARRRRIAMLVPHFLAVPNIIANSDLLCVVPRQLGRVYADSGAVRIVPLPFRSASFDVSLFWHKRFDADRGSAWLTGLIANLFKDENALVTRQRK